MNSDEVSSTRSIDFDLQGAMGVPSSELLED